MVLCACILSRLWLFEKIVTYLSGRKKEVRRLIFFDLNYRLKETGGIFLMWVSLTI